MDGTNTFYLVRHGQSTWNQIGRIQGKKDPPLSSLGRRQAQALADALRTVPLDALYSSPQRRARMTADAVASARQLAVTTAGGLSEIDHGYWEGLTEAEIQRRYGITFYSWVTRPSLTQMPGGEHFLSVQQRVLSAWQEIVARHHGCHVLVVSHDVPIRAIIASVLHLTLDHIGLFTVDNAAISIVQGTAGDLQLVQLNDRCHLHALTAP